MLQLHQLTPVNRSCLSYLQVAVRKRSQKNIRQNPEPAYQKKLKRSFWKKHRKKNQSFERELTKEEKEKLKQIILLLNLYEYNMF